MIIAFLTDVHGNYEALKSVSARLEREAPDRVVFLGDIVGYGANPNECVELMRSLAGDSVLGNHDAAAAGRESLADFNPVARAALEWTAGVLCEQYVQYLGSLHYSLDVAGVFCVHASPLRPDQWPYIIGAGQAAYGFAAFQQQVCMLGHTHVPAAFVKTPEGAVVTESSPEIVLEQGSRYIVNCGSVGQPRDGDPRACYGLLDTGLGTFRRERVAYDIPAAQKKIIAAGLPAFLAQRLAMGR